MIDPNAEVIGHRPPLKPIDLRHRREKVTREDIESGRVRQPDPAFYWCDIAGTWHLREGA